MTLGACGGDDDGEARQTCIANAENAAAAAVVARMYEQGELGPKEQVQDELGDGFFDDDGAMIPWEQLDADEQSTLANWWTSDRIDALAGDEIEEAREDLDPDC